MQNILLKFVLILFDRFRSSRLLIINRLNFRHQDVKALLNIHA